MTVRWLGAFGTTDVPVGQRFVGWSEYTTGAAALKARWRDGDALPAVVWREMYGNVNAYYNSTRQRIWSDVFVTTAAGDPTKNNTGTDWGDLDAIYAVTPELILYPSAYRGLDQPPQLAVKVRARKVGAANASAVSCRVYSVASLRGAVRDWNGTESASSSNQYASFSTTSTSYPAAAASGWLTESYIEEPAYQEREVSYQVSGGLSVVVPLWTTHLVIAGIGNGHGDGIYVAAVEVWEEEPGDG